MRRKNVAVITGASSGIGREFVLQMDQSFCRMDEIWLIARRREKLEELACMLGSKVRMICMDVTQESEVSGFVQLLQKEAPVLRMLVNCAGYGLMGNFADIGLQEQLGMLQVNCGALTEMTYHCIPYMRKNSRIIQLASSAAFLPQANFAVYAATKAYVLSFSRALGEELRERQIYVTAVCPGPVDTEFFEIAEKYGTTLAVKKLTFVTAGRVVRGALRASYYKRPLAVCSGWIKAFRIISALIPHSLLLRGMRYLK